MIAELGHVALALALGVAVFQSVVPLVGADRGWADWMGTAAPSAMAQLLLIGISFAALTHAFVTSDFSVRIVAENSHSLKPMLYKITGTWGNHEGSMLLWVLILALFGALVAAFGKALPLGLKARALAVQAMITVAFLAFVLFTSNPFDRLDPVPLNGNDLNPLLQDIGLALHPPFLYVGYVGLSMAFSFAVAALIEGRVDATWARWVRPWTLAAWVALTLGIALGSYWAYYELGWGGWWFWDPVENASFMPWLTGTALLHSAIVVEKRDSLKSWTVLLAIITFGLSLLGTFLVRSGVLTSVHAFAVDPGRGVFILILMVIAVAVPLALYAIRAPTLAPGGLFRPISREGALVFNNLILATAAGTVLIGTLYPLVLDAATGQSISVGPPFFNATFIPLMVPLIAALGVGPLLAWKRGDLPGALDRLKAAAVITAAVVLVTLWIHSSASVLAYLGVAMGSWALLGAIVELTERIQLGRVPLARSWARAKGLPRAAWGMFLAHAGLGIAIFGMVGTSGFSSEHIALMKAGDRVEIAGYTIQFDGSREVDGPNYVATRGDFQIFANPEDDTPIAVAAPEKRFFPVAQTQTTEAGIVERPFGEIYVVMGDQRLNPDASEAGWTVRLWFYPLVQLIWLGTTIMVVGGFVSLTDRRLRVGAPRRRAVPPPAHAVPAE